MVDLADDQRVEWASTLEVPDDPFFDEAAGFAAPVALDTGGTVQYGLPSYVDKDGTTVEFDGAYAALTSVVSPAQMMRFDAVDGRYSAIYAPGWPVDGDLAFAPLVPPEPQPPWDAGKAIDVDVPRPDGDVDGFAALFDASGALVWSHRWSPDAGQLALPALPTGHDAAEILGDDATGYLWVYAPDPADGAVVRYAGSALLDVGI